jgi:serine/threonine protein phosphatase PrpC
MVDSDRNRSWKGLGMKWNITAAERPSGQWRHQDRHIVLDLPADAANPGGKFIAVLDGHGESELTTDFCMKAIPEYFQEWPNPTFASKMLSELFRRLAADTATIQDGCAMSAAILKYDGSVVYGTLGDTFACAGSVDENSVNLAWTKLHSVFGNDDERKRLARGGAKISSGYLRGPKDEGLAMSRALGDSKFDAHLSRIPSLRSKDLVAGGFVILASDGYVDMSMPEYMHMGWLAGVEEKMSAEQLLAAEYHRLRSRGDDATVIMAYLEK